MSRNLAIVAVFAFGAVAAHAAIDGTIKLADDIGSGPGGAFKATILSTGPDTGLAGAASTFLTFCVERNEYLDFGPVYNVDVTTGAIKGGQTGGNPDPLDNATAWLYRKFINGELNGVGEFVNNSTVASIDALQDAIWHLEGETPQHALSTYDGLLAAALAAPVADYGVRVMNLYSSSGNNPMANFHQDLLVVVPEPSTYIAGGLLGLPVLIGAVRRRAAKTA